MDDFDGFVEFVKFVAQSPPRLTIALLEEAMKEYWFQSLATVAAFGGITLLAYFLRRKPRIHWHEFIVKPEKLPKPHKAPDNEPQPTTWLAPEDENGLCEWHRNLMKTSGIAFSKDEAQKLYSLKETEMEVEIAE